MLKPEVNRDELFPPEPYIYPCLKHTRKDYIYVDNLAGMSGGEAGPGRAR